MRINKISATNFKSYDKNGITFDFNEKINVIIGENNSGKSNLIRLFQMIHQKLGDSKSVPKVDRHDENESPFLASISVTLDDDDLLFLTELLQVPSTFLNDLKKLFTSPFVFNIESPMHGQVKLNATCGDMRVEYNRIWIHGTPGQQKDTALRSLVQTASTENKSLYLLARGILGTDEGDKVSHGVSFEGSFLAHFSALLEKKVIIFPEFRERPDRKASELLSSPKGRELASVLFNLKNGNATQVKRFAAIQDAFQSIFPNLTLQVNKEYEIYVIKSNGVQVTQEHFGAGVVEIIILLTHLKDYRGYVFMIDEPELHLHPHAKRLVAKLIQNASEQNQVICITHSAEFVRLDRFEDLIVIRDIDGVSRIIKIQSNSLQQDEIAKLRRIVDTDQKEFLFARRALLIEGDTEMGAMPTLSQKLKYDLDFYGVSLLNIGGNYFVSFIKMLDRFELPHLVMCDKDVLVNIGTSIQVGNEQVRTSSLIRQLDELGGLNEQHRELIKTLEGEIREQTGEDGKKRYIYSDAAFLQLLPIAQNHRFAVLSSDFEGVFKDAGYDHTLTDAKNEFGRSKVLQGKYLADKVDAVPDEIAKIITQACGNDQIKS